MQITEGNECTGAYGFNYFLIITPKLKVDTHVLVVIDRIKEHLDSDIQTTALEKEESS